MHVPVSCCCGVINFLHLTILATNLTSTATEQDMDEIQEASIEEQNLALLEWYLTQIALITVIRGLLRLLGMDGFQSGESTLWATMLDKNCFLSKEIHCCCDASAVQTSILIVGRKD